MTESTITLITGVLTSSAILGVTFGLLAVFFKR